MTDTTDFGSFPRSERIATQIVGAETDGTIRVLVVNDGQIRQRLEITPAANHRVALAIKAVTNRKNRQFRSWLSSRGWSTIVRAYGTDDPPTLFLAQRAPDGADFKPVRLTGEAIDELRKATHWQEAWGFMRGRVAS